LTVNASYTRLNEATGLLGGQGRGALSLSGGADTQAFTWGATLELPHGFSLAGSATVARTGATGFDHSALVIDGDGITSTAFEFAAAKTGVLGETDRLRISFAQPLHVENGALRYTSLEVVDRETGELGGVSQRWNLAGGTREYRTVAAYMTPIMDGRGEIGGFAMVNLNPTGVGIRSYDFAVGAQLRFGF
jgi:hypothetical protein